MNWIQPPLFFNCLAAVITYIIADRARMKFEDWLYRRQHPELFAVRGDPYTTPVMPMVSEQPNDLLLPGTGCIVTAKYIDVSALDRSLQDEWYNWVKDNLMPVHIQINAKTMVPLDHWYKFVKFKQLACHHQITLTPAEVDMLDKVGQYNIAQGKCEKCGMPILLDIFKGPEPIGSDLHYPGPKK